MPYAVCNHILDVEANEYCEFDGAPMIGRDGNPRCPGCGRRFDPSEIED